MIIKSMARDSASFEQLIDYIDKEEKALNLHIAYNFLIDDDKELIKQEFIRNSRYIRQSQGKNFLYHEVISLSENKLPLKKQQKILLDIAREYINKRASKCLVYAKIHNDQDNLHIHLCISANELGHNRRLRLSKKEFSDIQKDMEIYVKENFRELQEPKIYDKDNKERNKNRAEQELKNRTKEPTRKEIVYEELLKIFNSSNDIRTLETKLKNKDLELYIRGKTIGVLDVKGAKKYRLKTLKLEQSYADFHKRMEKLHNRHQDLEKAREVMNERDRKIKEHRDKV
jgi:hypothetical protein